MATIGIPPRRSSDWDQPPVQVEAEQLGEGAAPPHAGPAGEAAGLLPDVLADEHQPEGEDRQVQAAHARGQRRDQEGRGLRFGKGERPPDGVKDRCVPILAQSMPQPVGVPPGRPQVEQRHRGDRFGGRVIDNRQTLEHATFSGPMVSGCAQNPSRLLRPWGRFLLRKKRWAAVTACR